MNDDTAADQPQDLDCEVLVVGAGPTGLMTAIYLVRPDGYVAWRGDGLDFEGGRQFLTRFGLGGQTRR